MKIITYQQAREGKHTLYRSILAGAFCFMRRYYGDKKPETKAAWFVACFISKGYATHNLWWDRKLGKWTKITTGQITILLP